MRKTRGFDRTLEAPDAAAMRALGRAFGEAAPSGAVLLLEGPLGAGKTTFAQGVGEGCGVGEPVTSPTYNLVLHYRGRRPFTHVDLYRLADPADLETLDLNEILETGGITCIEWPKLIENRVRPPCARLRIDSGPVGADRRGVEIRCRGEGWELLNGRLAETAVRR
ncbi:MAG TPA: tRNA (adenosine(37)-N6)-threonylcarbamoyltransferase complex ATPase subunit type 1 TsaE [Gemmatimonadota bacterium]|nr:tRNA (adenosine(37)-N6)-threonylcarbamoyltransferase complex ATPase subunit type 1 TsaE [Gemmatimonadota bacterium]